MASSHIFEVSCCQRSTNPRKGTETDQTALAKTLLVRRSEKHKSPYPRLARLRAREGTVAEPNDSPWQFAAPQANCI